MEVGYVDLTGSEGRQKYFPKYRSTEECVGDNITHL